MATEHELSDFLKNVERRAFKRSVYHVRDEEAALDIVQDSMLKLAQHYGDKPITELPMLFQRILSNSTLDWFRRQKTQNALFTRMSDLEASAGDDATATSLLSDSRRRDAAAAMRPPCSSSSARGTVVRIVTRDKGPGRSLDRLSTSAFVDAKAVNAQPTPKATSAIATA